MRLVCRLIFCWAMLLATGLWVTAATLPEERSFQAAEEKFKAEFFQQADADFGEFCQKFPTSPLLPEAILFQAEARIKLTNYAGALDLLAAHQSQAGKRADSYLFWQAEAMRRKGDLQAAAELFDKLVREFPGSPHRLESAISESSCRARLSEWSRVLELLQDTNGVFQTAAHGNVTNEMVVRGYLLLSEGLFRKKEYGGAERALDSVANLPLTPQLIWQRQYLLCRILSATGRTEPALEASTNLLGMAAATAQSNLQADSLALQAELLERLGRASEAVAVYQKNLVPTAPSDRQRQALSKVLEILLGQNKVADAAQSIEKFIAQCPGADCADQAVLTLGELRLRQYQAGPETNLVAVATNPPSGTNFLLQALAAFQSFTNRFPQSPLFGKAQLDLGWCFWLTNKWPEAEIAFQSAVQKLAPSMDQAVAFFKLGDTQFKRTNFVGAIASYTAVLDRFSTSADVTNTLFEPVLYQIVRAGLESYNITKASGDLSTVTNALAKILAWFPTGFHTDRAVLLAGQEVGQREPAAARRLFMDVAKQATDSPLLPEIQLAVARTYEQEYDWNEAIQQYSTWLTAFTNHPSQARAEYSRARACYQAGQQTNAFNYFTNFLARFPNNEVAPLAQWWVATYYYNAGNLPAAEQNYQLIYQNTNWPVSDLTYQAILYAGRAAFARQSWKDAQDYFGKLVGSNSAPATLRAQAWIALGDTFVSQDSTNKFNDYRSALTAYDQVFTLCPSNELTALAWGQKASCLLQSAQIQDYLLATNAFRQVIGEPHADGKARTIATIGLGVTFEKLAQSKTGDEQLMFLKLALDQYLDALYGKVLREGEKRDSYWTREAGFRAARVAESLNQFRQAANVLQWLQDQFPPLRLQNRIDSLRAKELEAAQKN